MKLSRGLLLPAFIGAASALSDASVYIFQGDEWPNTSTPPTLTPEQARLVFAQRLGASRYHRLGDADESTLAYINKFGGHGDSLFQETAKDKAAELVLIVEGVSSNTAELLLEKWSAITPAFTISTPPSLAANSKLVVDLHHQSGQEGKSCPFEDAINPFNAECWNGKSKILHFELGSVKRLDDLMSVQERLRRFARKEEMNVVVVLMPEASRLSKSKLNPYGAYDKISQAPIARRSKPSEEPMAESSSILTTPLHYSKQVQISNASSNSSMKPIERIPPLCHASLDSCISATNNCSGHGECYRKYGGNGQEGKGGCFTCFCKPTLQTIPFPGGQKNGSTLQHWGGSACHKEDISDSFWLIFIFTVVIISVTGWAIAMIFSIGEEKLPGVIGAGVSGKTK